MQIILNGIPHPIASPLTVAELLESLSLAGKPMVVELDKQAVFPRDYDQSTVGDGASVEIVMLAAGG